MFLGVGSTLRRACLLTIFASLASGGPAFAQTAPLAELPRVFLDTTPVPPTGTTIAVPAGGAFQAALLQAQPTIAVKSRNAAGNLATSADFTFRTKRR